jgi:ABC-type amino acid transport substrate-binding protein
MNEFIMEDGQYVLNELGEKIDFSVSYAKNAQVAVVKKGSTLTVDGVKDAKIAVENGSAGATVADETIKGTKVNKVTAMVDALNEVLAGTSDVAIIDITMAQSVVGKGAYADLQILDGASYGDEIFAVGLRQGSDLKAKLDAFLKAKYADGTLTKLAEKYSVGLNTDALK